MKKRTQNRSFSFEKLEGRRLLAADCAMQAMPEIDSMENDQCEVASFECPADDIAADPAPDSEIVDEGPATPSSLDPRVLDLADGMDGYFGAINAENPAESIEFTAAGDGTVDVVLASSFGDAHASLSVSDSQGNLIETQAEGLEGFDMLSFEVEEGETYQLSITTDDANCDGHFQLTVGFEDYVDQHVDEIGSESTELTLVDNQAELTGRLESAGDSDTFRFNATADGEVTLELHETVEDARIGLGVSIHDSQGNILAEGATNEMLQISFDVDSGQEYYVSIAAGEGQKGTYAFGLDLKPAPELPTANIDDCDVADESVESDVADPDVTGPESFDTESADGQTTDETGVDNDVPVDCELVENDGDVSESDITDEPTEDEPIADEPIDAIAGEPVDQQLGDQQPESELVDSTDQQSDDDLLNAWVDSDIDDTIGACDNSETDSEPVEELDPDTGADELIVDAGAEVTDSEEENDERTFGIAEQEAVDDFFAELGNEIEMHFDFSFGRNFLDGIRTLV